MEDIGARATSMRDTQKLYHRVWPRVGPPGVWGLAQRPCSRDSSRKARQKQAWCLSDLPYRWTEWGPSTLVILLVHLAVFLQLHAFIGFVKLELV